MGKQEFETAAERITRIFRNRGEEAAVEERDRINRELATENQQLWFQGPAGGNFLAFFLQDVRTGQEVLPRITKMWIPTSFLKRH